MVGIDHKERERTPRAARVHKAGVLMWRMLTPELCNGLKPALAAPAAWGGGEEDGEEDDGEEDDGGTTRVVVTP